MIIYKHTSKTTGKAYIGLSKFTIDRRFQKHLCESRGGSDLHFHRAIRKYGENDWISEILKDNIETLENANELEYFYIDKYDTFNSGYNMTKGGWLANQIKKGPHKESSKKQISESLKSFAANLTNEERELQYKHNKGKSNPMYGKTRTDEDKSKLSAAGKIKIECPHCNKLCNRGMAKRWHFDNCKDKK